MSRSSDARRPYVRSTRSIVRRAAEGLANAAGRATPIERAHLEPLEPRKLLFTLTIDDASDPDGDGMGTVSNAFAYFIPYLATDLDPGEAEEIEVREDFNDEDIGPVFDTTFDGSDVRFESEGATASIAAPFDLDGNPIEELQVLDIQSFFGDESFLSFGVLRDTDNVGLGFLVNNQVTFRTGTGGFGQVPGLFNGQVQAQLLLRGEVVDTYTNAELLALAGGNVATDSTITLVNRNPEFENAFDELQFVVSVPDGDLPLNADFFIDDLIFIQPPGNNIELIDDRVFGVETIFTAPVGATISFFDLYGRPIVDTLGIGSATDLNVALGDLNDDGQPGFNDGIGSVVITGADADSRLSFIGLEIEDFGTGQPPANFVEFEGEFVGVYPDDLNLFSDFAEVGFGFAVDASDDDVSVVGLPPGAGSVIIGSPFIRPLGNYDPYGTAPNDFDFQRADQGIFVNADTDGNPVSFGQLSLSAALFGLSNFSGSVGHISTGYFMGAVNVAGDLGTFYNAGDAGAWIPVFENTPDGFDVNLFTVGSQISVGRTLGEYAAGGRSFVDITVDGDLSVPAVSPAEDVLVYNEREVTLAIDPGAPDAEFQSFLQQFRAIGANVLPEVVVSSDVARIEPAVVLPSLYGESNFRNDTILNAEFIGGASSTAVVRGVLGAADFFNDNDDEGDVYAFVADGTSEIVIEQIIRAPSVVRILDADGRTLAASEFSGETGGGTQIRFTPDAPGAYYISVLDSNDGEPSPITPRFYSFLISGMAPTSFGSYRTGLGNAGNDEDPIAPFDPLGEGDDDIATLTLLSGDVGIVRTATGIVDSSGEEVSPTEIFNSNSSLDSLFTTSGLSLSTPGSLFSFNAGGDINANTQDPSTPIILSIGGDLGQFYTGRSQVVGGGDVGNVIIETGGRIGTIDINGWVNGDRDASVSDATIERIVGEPFVIRTGLDDLQSGDIGLIIVGGSVVGDELVIDTSATPGSVVGGLLVSQRIGVAGVTDPLNDVGFFDGDEGVLLNLGAGSDIRFVDTPNIDLREAQGNSIPIISGQPVEFVDDAGGRVRISVSAATPFPVQFGEVIVVPVDGAEGVAIARININLPGNGTAVGGVTLNIDGLPGQSEDDVISIGRIVVGDSDIGSQILITGSAQIDVYRIDAPNGLGRIENQTPGGDIIAIDTDTLDTLRILDGDLGRTEVVEFGPRLIGPRLGVQLGVDNDVFGALGVDQAGDSGGILDTSADGDVFRPTNVGLVAEFDAFLEDIGFPLDDTLNGLVVRNGGLTLAETSGSIGDVILQGGDIVTVRANFNRQTDTGEFNGIVGTIFSPGNIEFVDVGDGLVSSETGTGTPFAEGGIFAQNNIGRVEATIDGSFINGIISASAAFVADGNTPTSGIDQIIVNSNGGGIVDSDLLTSQLDTWWNGELLDNDEVVFSDTFREITVTNGDVFRSRIGAFILQDFRITGGAYDATLLEVTGEVSGEISADEFRNSTLDGGLLEFAESTIEIAQDLERLSTNNNGQFADTQLSVIGEVRGSITTGSVVRSAIEVANTLRAFTINGDLLASELVTGRIIAMTVLDSIRVSSISVSGPLENLRVQDEIDRSEISVTGPDGRIDTLEAVNDLDAQISSSGRIGTLRSTMGSIDGSIVTTNEDADIVLIDAAIDVLSTTDIGGNLAQIQAGRNIGDANDPGVILVRGNLTELDVEDGRLFSDLRVGGTLTNQITIGGVVNLPTQEKPEDGDIVVFGRIEEVAITGDYDGLITSESAGIGLVTITDGSLLASGGVIANDGGIGTLSIIRGHLFGTVFAELTINQIIVDGQGTAFGDIGINPNLSAGVGTNTNDPNRNQLPPNVVATLNVDGPTIASGRSINSIVVTSGDIYESFIYARTFIGLIDVQSGNITLNDNVNLSQANVIAAGDLIGEVNVSGNVRSTLFLAGVTSFGDESIFLIGDPLYDDIAGNPVTPTTLPGNDTNGGVGDGVDTLKSGTIRSVTIGGDASNVAFNAGITAGDDGDYTEFDGTEQNVLGLSIIDEIQIGGTQTDVTFNADRGAIFVNGVNVRSSNPGATSPNAGGQLASLTDAFVNGPIDLSLLGTEVPRNGSAEFAWNGATFRVEWNAPAPDGSLNEDDGQGVIWDGNGTLILANTRIDHEVIVTVLDNDDNAGTALPSLIDFNIRSNDEASVGTLRVQGENGRSRLIGNSNIVVDNFVRSLEFDDYEGTGIIAVGEDIETLTADRVTGGTFSAGFVQTTNINLSLFALNGNVPRFDYIGAGSFNVGQNATATVNIDRSIGSIDIAGRADRFLFRAGGSLNSFAAGEVERSRLSVSNVIDSIEVEGDVFDSSFIAGGDLGSDALDGNGSVSSAIDRATSGTINSVDIGGDFGESDIIAGFLRGGDGFFATADDDGAAGNSSIGTVDIGGSVVGSNVNSESFGLISAGGIVSASIGGQDAASSGNFTVGQIIGEPVPIQVSNFEVVQDSRVYTAFITFNQNIDETSFLQALRIREIRDETSALQPFDPNDPLSLEAPTPGIRGSGDYTIAYDEELFTFAVTFDREITDRDLLPVIDPAVTDAVFIGARDNVASPGIYRFEILSDVLRAQNAQARLDGDGDGFALPGENFNFDDIVGDAGDVAGPRGLERVVLTGLNNNTEIIDFYDAIDLNIVLDSNTTPDGLPETNTEFTIRGALADHPDRDLDLFGFGGDKDVYAFTLQAGQILRLGEVNGPANQIVRSLFFQPTDGSDPILQYSSTGISEVALETQQTITLPSNSAFEVDGDLVTDGAVLVQETGTYYLVVEAGDVAAFFQSPFIPGLVPNLDPQANQTGNYAFTFEIFDDGDSGFNAGADSGNGTNIVNAPSLSLFSTTDPTERVVIGDFSFQRLAGADGVFGNGDDQVFGQTSDGAIVSTRSGSQLVSTVSASLGPAASSGRPGEIFSDVDVFHLNNFQPISAGTFVTLTVKLAESGTDLGSITEAFVGDERIDITEVGRDPSQAVQFALFETTQSTTQQNADLVFSPTDFGSRAGVPNTLIAQNGPNQYGFDANGDFFISFVVPPSINGGDGSYAVYLQGVFRGDYQIEVVTQGTGVVQSGPQNVLIESQGGTVDWLAVNGAPISFGGFDADALGFSGLADNVTIDEFILTEVLANLQTLFRDQAGLDISFSLDPADFEFEEFSTVFISSDFDTTDLILASDYGVSERSDPFNSDPEDEAIVFTPVYSTLGYSPTPDDLDDFIDSLTNGVARRVGELVGLRLTQANLESEAGGPIDVLNEESIAFPFVEPGDPLTTTTFELPTQSRELVNQIDGLFGINDTGFFIGDQNAVGLLSLYLD
ncbi:MAG: hypothetical protein AAGJ54_06740 [Planctomycetota bacterium]